eukprot:CAMPEP_0197023520 /NCGR_PEP_ID=MMETSP1384-20130603/4193_1 /TAXON_ID=29189 /ORGANISM="Ammonia sp." /LENGTH=516 /DNA_ID=CAMNT_0042451739 /DNA_START=50 /DNA_END=1600 /DNA_ORIENTATION=-
MPQRKKKQQGGGKKKQPQKKQQQKKASPKKATTAQQTPPEKDNASKEATKNEDELKAEQNTETNGAPKAEASASAASATASASAVAPVVKKKKKKREDEEEEEETAEEKKEKTVKELLYERPNADKRNPNRPHQFWNNQPVPQMDQEFEDNVNEPMEEKTLDDVRKQPYLLPAQFEWVELDLNDDKEVDELYELLANHYVEDDDNRFRFNYSKEFLKWALMVPGYLKTWHLGVRSVQTRKLCGCITAIPATVSIYNRVVNMVEINFLCVHKKLRSKRVAPVLIKEITRRVNCTERWQAVYTAGVVLPKPIASNRYWHRSLNPEKLVDVGFSSMNKRMTKPRLRKLYKLPTETQTSGLRVMVESDCESAHKLLTNYLNQFGLHVHFTLDEFKHCFLTQKGVVYSYVKQDAKSKEITDFISFYELPSTIMNHPKYNGMKAAYSYYNVATTVDWMKIMNDALILAKQLGFDVFNALDVMENEKFLKDLKFKIGDGHLQYYLYNWKCKQLTSNQVALVLL